MRKILLTLLVFVFFAATPSARGETLTLKNGEQISGRVSGSDSETLVIALDKGGYRIVKRADIAPTPKKPPTTLPVLQDTLSGLLDKLATRGSRKGVIAQIDGKKVYTDLGEGDGILIGDELEIDRAPAAAAAPGETPKGGRNVVGRLRVTAVQKGMSTCEVTSGLPEMKGPTGELDQITLSSESVWPKTFLSEVNAPDNCGLTKDDLRNALLSTARTRAMRFVDEGAADAVLRVEADPAEGGVNIVLVLSGKTGGHELLRAEAFHKTMLTAEDIGLHSAISASLGAALNMAPTEKALGDAFSECANLGGVLFIPRAGAENEPAWVFSNGTIVIGAVQDLPSSKEASQLASAWLKVARAATVVTAAAPKTGLDAILRRAIKVYTEKPEQYQYIFVERAPDAFLLSWPVGSQAWSCFSGKGWRSSTLLVDERRVCSGNDNVASCSFAGIEFGEHSVRSLGWEWFYLEAFFPSPSGRIDVCDKAKNPIATSSAYSSALSSLYLPVPQGVAGIEQDRKGSDAQAMQSAPSPSAGGK